MSNPDYLTLAFDPPFPRSEDYPLSYDDFDRNFPAVDRHRLYGVIDAAAQGAGIDDPEERLLLSAFAHGYGPDELDAADAYKLSVRSAAPAHGIGDVAGVGAFGFDGDDSNMANIVERERHGLRRQKLEIALELEAAGGAGILTEAMRLQARTRLQELDEEIAKLGKLQAQADHAVPVYYATPFDGLLSDEPEDNPLAYLPETGEPGFLAAFDRPALEVSGIPVTEKNDTQLRIAGTGRAIMEHCVLVVHL